jgi:mRNA interferase RelE/StbE
MSYDLHFKPAALKEWKKLDSSLQKQFKKKLNERLVNPKVTSDKLSGFENVYKIKLRNAGYRLAYEVQDKMVVVLVLKIGKRDKFYNNLQNSI